MAKKKIALFINGYCAEILTQFLESFWDGLQGQKIDVYSFCAYPSFVLNEAEVSAELNIYNLPDLNYFDVAIIVANGMDYIDIFEKIHKKCLDANIPYITVAVKTKEGHSVCSDNTVGTRDLIEYVIDVLGLKDIAFVAGSSDNADSNFRLEMVRKVMRERGMELGNDPTRTFYSNWELQSAIDYVNIIHDKGCVPEIVICANDELAMTTSNEFERLGYNVPDDVMITGFDNGHFSKIFNPSLSTVDQNFEQIGSKCARLAIDIINGKTDIQHVVVDSKFICRESTKGGSDSESERLRRELGKNEFNTGVVDTALSRKIGELDRRIASSGSLYEVQENLKVAYDLFAYYEKEGFHICLDKRYIASIEEMRDDFKSFEYSDEFYVVYSRERGVEYSSIMMPRHQLVPHIIESDEPRYFLFSPLQELGRTFGYMIQCDRLDRINVKNDLKKYEEALAIAFDRLRQRIQLNKLNQKLLDLSQTDSLTSVKNRNAYEQKERDYDDMIKREPETVFFSIAVFDVNNLKKINDNYGHEKGDAYIINSCMLLCQAYKHSPVYRIGGDEFVVILTGDDDNNKHDILKQLYLDMKFLAEADIDLVKKVSIAGGIASFDCKKDTCFADVFNRADAIMYDRKMAMKANSNEFIV